MSSSTSQSSSRYVSPHSSQKTCEHGVDVFTSMTPENPARRFSRCSRRKGPEKCGHFEWIDPSFPPFQKGCFVNLMGQKKSLEEQLRCKEVMENLMIERMSIKVSEIEKVQDLYEQTQYLLEVQTLKCEDMEKKMKIAMDKVSKLQRMFAMAAIWLIILIFIILILVYSKRDNRTNGYIELGQLNFVG
ncbi:Unknown protein [Striga hermonthica]|uniref:GRF-type domain-containing protein n=1 Tax=Striga hermonthica TaxID=68872 RepID=A0A9N7N8U4_STRHE|nr:Unknown protein [Striga hermonthica]